MTAQLIVFTRKHQDGLASSTMGIPFESIVMINTKDDNSFWLKYKDEREVKSCVVLESPQDVQAQLHYLRGSINAS